MRKRYGYLDMPEGWSDVADWPVTVKAECPECGRVREVELDAEAVGGLAPGGDGIYHGADELVCFDCIRQEAF